MLQTAMNGATSEAILGEMMTSAVEKVFTTMIHRPVSLLPAPGKGDDAQSDAASLEGGDYTVVVGTVGFVGKINGLIYLYLPEALARRIAATMLGLEPADLGENDAETVNDAIGELTNMIVGTFKNQLCDRGFDCRLTIPSILRGSHFTIEPAVSTVVRRIFQFETAGERFLSDLLIEANN
jgi:chemotaxis protein CheX